MLAKNRKYGFSCVLLEENDFLLKEMRMLKPIFSHALSLIENNVTTWSSEPEHR